MNGIVLDFFVFISFAASVSKLLQTWDLLTSKEQYLLCSIKKKLKNLLDVKKVKNAATKDCFYCGLFYCFCFCCRIISVFTKETNIM